MPDNWLFPKGASQRLPTRAAPELAALSARDARAEIRFSSPTSYCTHSSLSRKTERAQHKTWCHQLGPSFAVQLQVHQVQDTSYQDFRPSKLGLSACQIALTSIVARTSPGRWHALNAIFGR